MNYKADFPVLAQSVHGKPLVYLDSAASAQKSHAVIDAMSAYYQTHHANIHRGIHALSEQSTRLFENARQRVQKFLNATSAQEIIFTSGTTASINLVAQSFGRENFRENDEILISEMEHHSNIVPWQLICQQTGATLKVIPVTERGELDLLAFENLISSKTKIVAITHVSNVLGTINPVKKIIKIAHAAGVPVLLDGAQAVPHLAVDVLDLDCDFYAFSAHKLYGPTGIGVLYGKRALLDKMPPWQGGGGMVGQVRFSGTTYAELPYKFEAGTPPIAEAIGLHAAIDYLEAISFKTLAAKEEQLRELTLKQLKSWPCVRLLGDAADRVSVISFVLADSHAHDVATILDRAGVAVRAGHHCAMPLMERFKVPACVRVSFGLYNTVDDVEILFEGLQDVMRIFA